MYSETIAAISTPLSNGGISIVRMSGPDAFSIIDKVYSSPGGKKILSKEQSHTVHYGFIKDDEEIIDEVMVVILRGPSTYTREDTVEIDCHGGVIVTRKILDLLLKNGARPAEPGEFTKRAFLNGRIDLSQAEAVMNLISSKNDFAMKNSISHLQGKIYDKIKELRETMITDIAFIEAALDDPEHIEIDGFSDTLFEHTELALGDIQRLIKNSDIGQIRNEGINTVIVGKPNAGKSSVLNALLGEERAIVTSIEGTTRDVLQESISFGDFSLNLMDTAGIRYTEDIVEKIGVDKAKEYLEMADLVIYVIDGSVEMDENDEEIISLIQEKHSIILLNKSDLDFVVTKEKLLKKCDFPIIEISAKNEDGITEVEQCIREMFFEGRLTFNDEIYITSARQKNALVTAKESLNNVKESIEAGMPEDFYTIDLMNAYSQLGLIIGEEVEDDIVDKVFKEFCMGK